MTFIKNLFSKHEKPENNKKNMEQPANIITIYGTTWCGDSRRARTFFETNNIPFKFIDIDKDADAEAFVKNVNRGYRSVPTIVFPDGTMLVEPSSFQLKEKFGL